MEKAKFIKNSFGEKLEVLVRKPDNKGRFSAVLFVPGFGMDLHEYNNSFDEIAKMLVKTGFLTMQFSFAGCGKSEGDFVEMTFKRQAQQVKDMFNCLGQRKDVDKERIGIIAQSCGVPSTILALPLKIKAFVSVSGVVEPSKSLKQVLKERGVKFTPDKIIDFPRSSGKIDRIGPQFWKETEEYNLVKTLHRFSYPLLVIHGTEDTKISTDEAKSMVCGYKGRHNLKIFAGGDHGIQDVPRKMREEFLEEIGKWTKKTI